MKCIFLYMCLNAVRFFTSQSHDPLPPNQMGWLRFVNDFGCLKKISTAYVKSHQQFFAFICHEKLQQQFSKGNYHLFRHTKYLQVSSQSYEFNLIKLHFFSLRIPYLSIAKGVTVSERKIFQHNSNNPDQ